jgi:hypothetical protein
LQAAILHIPFRLPTLRRSQVSADFMTEAQLQSKAFTNFWNNNPHLRGRLFAINQNSHNQIKGAINRSLGVLPGVSDMAYLIPGSVVWIEWKTPSGKQSTDQRKFQALVTSLGMQYHIVTSEEEFLKVIAPYADQAP